MTRIEKFCADLGSKLGDDVDASVTALHELGDRSVEAITYAVNEAYREGAIEHFVALARKVGHQEPICGFCSADSFQASAIAAMITSYARQIEREGKV